MERRINIIDLKVFAHEDGKISIDLNKNKELTNDDFIVILEKIIEEFNRKEVN